MINDSLEVFLQLLIKSLIKSVKNKSIWTLINLYKNPSDKNIYLEAKIGGRNDLGAPWTEITRSQLVRPFECEEEDFGYSCDPMDFVELGN